MTSAAAYLPARLSLAALRRALPECRGCDLYARATHAVPGEGLRRARLVLVGEQPGDREDRTGRPFVGPAGALLDRALAEAGIARRDAYVTNVVKHFKWKASGGRRRIHERPSPNEVRACLPWFEAEIAIVDPEAVLALGATAAQALYGRAFRVGRERGRVFPSRWARCSAATVHPAAVLRAPDDAARRRAYDALVRDLGRLAAALGGGS